LIGKGTRFPIISSGDEDLAVSDCEKRCRGRSSGSENEDRRRTIQFDGLQGMHHTCNVGVVADKAFVVRHDRVHCARPRSLSRRFVHSDKCVLLVWHRDGDTVEIARSQCVGHLIEAIHTYLHEPELSVDSEGCERRVVNSGRA
jgi:hypothetical protein